MGREIPASVPPEISQLIYKGWEDMRVFSDSLADELMSRDSRLQINKEKFYDTVYSLLAKSRHTHLAPIASLSERIGVSMEDVCDLMVDESRANRRAAVDSWRTACGVTTDERLAKIIGVSKSYISHLVNGALAGDRLRNVRHVAGHLGVELKDFYRCYNKSLLAVS